ncbi:MAG: hypothetical protein U0791_05265 [Gemmataceae bacterium]
MPITLGCPSCGKRFRAREESSGKKVKCPFCQAAVPVPSAEQAHAAGGPTEALPASGGPSPMGTLSFSPPPPPAAPVPSASPAAWGAQARPTALEAPIPFQAPEPAPIHRPVPIAPMPSRPARPARTTEETNSAAWMKCRSGLGKVMIGLFWFSLLGFIPIGKIVYERSVGPLPTGESAEWFKIEGVLNTPGENAVSLTKSEAIDLLAFGVPVLLGGLSLTFGRVAAGAAPRNSGAKGLFAFSGLLTLVALAGGITVVVCKRGAYNEVAGYAWWAAVLGTCIAEFWFLIGLVAAGAALRRPATVRAAGLHAFCIGVGVALYFFGWDLMLEKLGPQIGRPKQPEAGSDWLLYEASALLLGWLILIGGAWRTVSGVRAAIDDYARE